MLRRTALALLAALPLLTLPATAMDEAEVMSNIENLQGDANGFFEVFGLVQDAFNFGDPVTVADHVAYPITINANGETYDVQAKQDMLDNFDTLVSPETRTAVGNQDVGDLIVNSDGVGIGNGAIWMANVCLNDACSKTVWKITAINN